jgi:hypothetical protein
MRSLRSVLLCAIAVLTLAPVAQAATDNTQIQLTGGDLTYSTAFGADDFNGVTLNGLPQVARTEVDDWVVTDARGGNNGWNVTIAASQFTDGTKTLPAGSMTLATVPVPTTNLTNLSVPPLPVALANPIDGGSTQKMVTAPSLTGLGKWTFTSLNAAGGDLTLTVPPHALAGTYTSTITTTLSSGP